MSLCEGRQSNVKSVKRSWKIVQTGSGGSDEKGRGREVRGPRIRDRIL
jgi:hypothetical protein